MINNYQQPKDFLIPNDVWWIVYEENTKQVISYIQPPGERGYLSSPHILITTNIKEELEEYIINNDLVLPLKPDMPFSPIYSIE
jgi:hypothetical protein